MSNVKVEDYNINCIFILECEDDNKKIVRGTCFSISEKYILTANHNLLENISAIRIYTSSENYQSSKYIEAKVLCVNEDMDVALLESISYSFTDHIDLNVTGVSMETEVLSCGYPNEKDFHDAPIKVKVTNNFENNNNRKYSFEVSQSNTVSVYKGMSGSPVLYNKQCIGIILVQQGANTLYAISIKDIIRDESILNDLNSGGVNINLLEGFDYKPPQYPKSPFNYCINCNESDPNIKGVDIGFTFKKWNIQNFTELMYDWVIDYALSLKDRQNFQGGSHQLFKHAKTNYHIGNLDALADLCLHVAIRESYKTIPVMNKLFDLNNKTFSCTHAVLNIDKLELWIGASSVNNNIEDAVINSIENIKYILDNKSLKNRFYALTNQIDDSWPHREKLERLSDATLSLEERFDKIIIPVFIMHDSDLINNYDKNNFLKLFDQHVKYTRSVITSNIDSDEINLIDLRVFCFPVSDIQKINEAFVAEIN